MAQDSMLAFFGVPGKCVDGTILEFCLFDSVSSTREGRLWEREGRYRSGEDG